MNEQRQPRLLDAPVVQVTCPRCGTNAVVIARVNGRDTFLACTLCGLRLNRPRSARRRRRR